VINRGGEKVDRLEVEAVLREHPDVEDVAGFGLADQELGARIAAAVVLRELVDITTLGVWCANRLTRFKVPEVIVTVDAIPLTELGKVSRKDLRAIVERSP